jgi:hypothetical protein
LKVLPVKLPAQNLLASNLEIETEQRRRENQNDCGNNHGFSPVLEVGIRHGFARSKKAETGSLHRFLLKLHDRIS